ncbi:hypothetical protein [Campylobacter ureolyticus]|uniref:hypothetical protein n=1 Tax=Campylobacter ureolyticus TaxID=827 RepID=UPI001FC898CC|nr:hypothetical protein [Campylobacter ureolyticus]MCZ6106045.1 hypothetical protein [Campylobacter ureolyticus]MCZ6158743.1 hypothetical protein [Campylobacter ureolyticus]GKH61386.1 hypothetical protein CE91St25_17220 [Campylobacter ureolyticus]
MNKIDDLNKKYNLNFERGLSINGFCVQYFNYLFHYIAENSDIKEDHNLHRLNFSNCFIFIEKNKEILVTTIEKELLKQPLWEESIFNIKKKKPQYII